MNKGISGAVLTAMGARTHHMTVVGSTPVNERFHLVHCHSGTLLDDAGGPPGDWIRIWFPDDRRPGRSFQRGYTLMNVDRQAGTFDLGFVLHEPAGPASRWARRCRPGDMLEVKSYSGQPFQLLDPPPRGYLLLGDLASYPAITGIVARIPEDVPVVAYLVSRDPVDERFELPTGPHITAHWVPELPDSRALVSVLEGRDFTGWYAWVGSESTETRYARTLLQQEHNLGKADLHAQAYWVRGREMGSSREESVAPRAQPPAVLRPARTALIAGGMVQGLVSLAQVIPFILLVEFARLLLHGADRGEFLRVGVGALSVMIGAAAMGVVLMALLHRFEASFSADLRRRLVHVLGRLPLGWFRNRDSGDIRSLVADDVAALHYLIVHAAVDLVGATVTPLLMLAYLFAVDWRLGLVLVAPVLGFTVLMVRISLRDREKMWELQRRTSLLTSHAQRHLTAQETIRIFGDRAVSELPAALGEMRTFLTDWQHETGPAKMTATLLNRPFSVMALLLGTGWLFVAAGWTDPVALLPFLILGTSIGSRMIGITHAAGGLSAGLRAREGLELLLATPQLSGQEVAEAAGGSRSPALRMRSVSFGYSPERRILDRVNLSLAPGTVTALVGASGSGKSTITSLLARLWDPDSGTVYLHGRDVRSFPQEEYYRRVCVMLQDVHLVHATIAENIALSAPGADRGQIEKAARQAHIDEDIRALPEGYDTVVRDGDLSGGQRQRIGIARALLSDAEVIILDEPTSAEDPATERELLTSLDRLLEGRTAVVVAHRLHTIREADRILVIDDGRIIEDGTHEDLLHHGGSYSRLWGAGEKTERTQ